MIQHNHHKTLQLTTYIIFLSYVIFYIYVMKTFESYMSVDDIRTKFRLYSHIDTLVIVFDFIKYPEDIFYYNDYKCIRKILFSYDKEFHRFCIYPWFSNNFDGNYNVVNNELIKLINQYFKINISSLHYNNDSKELEKNFYL